MRNLRFILLCACLALGQEPASPPAGPQQLVNAGQPIAVPFGCSDDDILWAGMVCSAQTPCPVYLELTHAESAGKNIFVTGNIHSSSITLYSVLLASDDAGLTWREAHERIRGAALDRIQFVGTQNGWISGQLNAPLAQDPFLLITTDAGQSWRQQPIFDETRVGSIIQFYFRDKTEGSLIFELAVPPRRRYQTYESHDGGASWTITEDSEQLHLPRDSNAFRQGNWRVSTDGPTQSFHIEQQLVAPPYNPRWDSVAAFAVNLGGCKPAEPE